MVSLVCENCSTPLPLGSRYCNACGTPVPGESLQGAFAPNGATDLREALQVATGDEYEIHHELGRGGMGSVFLAREVGLDRLVAIKVLPPSLMFDGSLVSRFKREARMVAKLHHPNIIPVYRVHHANDLVFYTMHYVPGRTLGEIMTPGRVMSIPEAEKILLEAGAGLGYAHKRGVIHRDVKPANVLIDGESRVHLTDFGIAKALAGSPKITETGAVIGTPQYMAPEQCEGRLVDGRADQYALAIVGYQMLAGHPPFESDSMKELLYHHLFTPPTTLNDIRPDAPQPLRDALHKALSKDPADRFDTMEDFQAAIEGKGPPIFVNWLDAPVARPEAEPTDSNPPRRRWSDADTTERLPERRRAARQAQRGRWDSSLLAESVTSHHRQAMGALVLTALTVAVVGVLALANGVRTAGSAPDDVPSEPPVLADRSDGGDAGPTLGSDVLAAGAFAGGSPPATPEPARGRLIVGGELPADATLAIDGEEISAAAWKGSAIELSPGVRRVVINAAGHRPFRREVLVESAGVVELAVSLERVAPPQPVVRRGARPKVPRTLAAGLEQLIAEGRALKEAGRYVEAVEAYQEVVTRVGARAGRYLDEYVLIDLRVRADSLLKEARRACEAEKEAGEQRHCP